MSAEGILRFRLAGLLLLAATCVGGGPGVFAQEHPPEGVAPTAAPAPTARAAPAPDHRARDLIQRLELTESQQRALAKVLANEHEQLRKLWQQSNAAPELRASATRGIHDKTEGQIRALLTDEQRKKYLVHREGEPLDASGRSKEDDWFNAPKAK